MESLLADANAREGDYDWLGASESYRKTLNLLSESDVFKKGEIYERLGYAIFRAARQAESVDEFRERIHQAIENYENAKTFYQRLDRAKPDGLALRCSAILAQLDYWLAATASEKRALLEKSWGLTKQSLKIFQAAQDTLEYGRTHNELAAFAGLLFFYVRFPNSREILKEGLVYAEQTIKLLSQTSDSDELARAYVIASGWSWSAASAVSDSTEQNSCREKALAYWARGLELSEKAALMQGLLPPALYGPNVDIAVGSDGAVVLARKQLEAARKSRDKLFLGFAFEFLSRQTFWKAFGLEANEASTMWKEALEYANEAKNQHSLIRFMTPGLGVAWSGEPRTECYWALSTLETDHEKKQELLEKALKSAPGLLKAAEESAYPYAVTTAHHVYSKVLESLAQLEKKTDLRKDLLEEALEQRKTAIEIYEQVFPYFYWDLGVFQNYLANIESQLARFVSREANVELLRSAVQAKERCLQLTGKQLSVIEGLAAPSQIAWIGQRRFEFGKLLTSLWDVTGDQEDLRKATETFELAVEAFAKTNLPSRCAESYWKAALSYGMLGEHLNSVERFKKAAESYRLAAEEIAPLREFYQDYAFYMEAWSEIERAKLHHSKQEYGLAAEDYQKVAELHKTTKLWALFAPNYSALSELEKGENLSREVQCEVAVTAFEEAARLFEETRHSLQSTLGKIESDDEKKMAAELARAADWRHEYCKARMLIEEARVLGKKGEHDSSTTRYGEAARVLEKLSKNVVSEEDRREILLIMTLSKAWQVMECAEMKASSKLYVEAANLFDEAREFTQNEKQQMLIQGHSHFCEALGAETEFTSRRDESIRETATRHLQTASDYYLKAGFRSEAEYSKANKLLLDAHLYMDAANREAAPEKKAKLYVMTEKVLEASADCFEKAAQPTRKQQVISLLEQVKKDKELAISLADVMQAPSIVSATSAFSAPTPTYERPVGLERFEGANIQASLIAGRRNLKVGEPLELEVELVNAGRGSAHLMKMEEFMPEGFDLAEKPEGFRVEDGSLNLKGRKLESLKTQELKMVLKPRVQGHFTFKPRILYLDENGIYKSHESEPVEITVKELGVSGWIKGSSK